MNAELLKDLNKLRKVKTYMDGAVAAVKFDRSNISKLSVYILPTVGHFRNCFIQFEMNVRDYPNQKPTVICRTKIFHPNVSTSGSICFSAFGSHWKSGTRILELVNGLVFHVNFPNPGSALTGICAIKNEEEYDDHVQRAAMGEKMKNKDWDFCYVNRDSLPFEMKDSKQFAAKVGYLESFLDRFKILSKVLVRVTSLKSKFHNIRKSNYVKAFSEMDETMNSKNCESYYDNVFKAIDGLFKKMSVLAGENVGEKNDKKKVFECEEYCLYKSKIEEYLLGLDRIHGLEKTFVATVSSLAVSLSNNLKSEIFKRYYYGDVCSLRGIIASNLETLNELVEEGEEVESDKPTSLEEDVARFNGLVKKIELVKKTNKLIFEYLSSVEKVWGNDGNKKLYQRFERRVKEVRGKCDSLVIVKLDTFGNKNTARVSTRVSSQSVCKESKYFLKELVIKISDLKEEVEKSDFAILVSNGREFVDFESLSLSLNKRVEFYKLMNSKKLPMPYLNSIPFFFKFFKNKEDGGDAVPVFINSAILDFREDQMVYFASGSPHYLLGLSVKDLRKVIYESNFMGSTENEVEVEEEEEEENSFLNVVKFDTLQGTGVHDGSVKKYKDKNFDFWFKVKKVTKD